MSSQGWPDVCFLDRSATRTLKPGPDGAFDKERAPQQHRFGGRLAWSVLLGGHEERKRRSLVCRSLLHAAFCLEGNTEMGVHGAETVPVSAEFDVPTSQTRSSLIQLGEG